MIQVAKIKVLGEVQGVFFRESARAEARKLSLNGFAQNEVDGSIYLEAEGPDETIKKFIDWCRKGPPQAQVRNIEIDLSDEPVYYKSFEIL